VVLIDRIAWLRLHVLLIDEKVSAGSPMSPHDQRAYLAFSLTSPIQPVEST
jgi:hypothetical protein